MLLADGVRKFGYFIKALLNPAAKLDSGPQGLLDVACLVVWEQSSSDGMLEALVCGCLLSG
jgi:hypothetical protein